MAKAQAKLVDEIWAKRAPDLPIKSPGELVTLASIVEKETGKADERPRVAGVFVNRLQKHMKLQSDPTIVYGLVFGKGTLGHPITKAELDQPTPYNTYNIDGLPPGPICNPGRAALEAAANPMRTKELYFVADGTGGHAFAETLDQHLKNVAHWRQIEQDAKDQLAPDATPTPAPTPTPAKHSALDGVDPAIFGAVALGDAPVDSGPLAARLGKLAENRRPRPRCSVPTARCRRPTPPAPASTTRRGRHRRQRRAADAGLPRRSGALTPRSRSPRSRCRRRRSPTRRRASPVMSTPAPPIRASPGSTRPPARRLRPRAFDASEGTPFDPLRNKTYDLNYAHAVPALDLLRRGALVGFVAASAIDKAIAQALETLRLLIAPGRSSRASASQCSRVRRRKPRSSAPSTSASGRSSRVACSVAGASESRPTRQ